MKCTKPTLSLWLLVVLLSGCGSGETNLPTTEFTDEQKAAIVAEDAAVADEEMGGGLPPVKRKRKQ